VTTRYDPERIRSQLRTVRIERMFRLIPTKHRRRPLGAVSAPSRFSDPAGKYAVLYAAKQCGAAFGRLWRATDSPGASVACYRGPTSRPGWWFRFAPRALCSSWTCEEMVRSEYPHRPPLPTTPITRQPVRYPRLPMPASGKRTASCSNRDRPSGSGARGRCCRPFASGSCSAGISR
jgi:hypothetical protein